MENKGQLFKFVMFYGLLLGLFWVVKYVFFILGIAYPALGIVYWLLTSLTLVFAYIFGKAYKIMIGGRIHFFHAWQFGVLLYFFASLIVSLLHYVFYRYLAPPNYLANLMEAAAMMVKEINPQAEETLKQMLVPTPIRQTFQDIFTNVFYGAVFSIPVAALLCRKIIVGIVYRENQENKEEKE
ncbi:MAG: DUF4199 domain-containing protein [Tannerellaceae bacterium]|jgi:hypothetical protein|nr:DUF4199 domain-containing protein [Tannerellaceae bacterium]